MHKHKSGDIVTIKYDLEVDGDAGIVDVMTRYAGKTAVIRSLEANDAYKLDIDRGVYYWWDYCFEEEEEDIPDVEDTEFNKLI